MRRYDSLALGGLISEEKLQERITALFSFVERADTAALRKAALDKESEKISELEYKKTVKGHLPCAPGRELEQQRQQLPLR